MGRTPSLTAQARCPDFYEWGKNGGMREWERGEKGGRFSAHKGNARTDLHEVSPHAAALSAFWWMEWWAFRFCFQIDPWLYCVIQ